MAMANLGSKLKDLRESKGLTINDIAEKVKISPRVLEAIESGNREALPHTVYAKGFITSFALVLGYDQEELAADLHEVFNTELPENAQAISGPLGRSSNGGLSKFSKVLIALIFLGIIGACYHHWHDQIHHLTTIDFSSLAKKPFMAETTKSVIPLASKESKPLNTVAQKKPEPEVIPAESTVEPIATVSEDMAIESDEKTADAEDELVNTDELVAQTLQETHVVKIVVDKEQCWIGSETDGGAQKSETLRVGQEKDYPYTKSLRLILGNPSAVVLTHDGSAYDRQLDGSRREILQFP